MIKRRFHKGGHGGDSSDSSSSSDSDSDSIPEVEEPKENEQEQAEDQDDEKEEGQEGDDVAIEIDTLEKKKKKKNKRKKRPSSSGSGYESEDSSINEVTVDSSGLLASEEESTERGGEGSQFTEKAGTRETQEAVSKSADGTLNFDDSLRSEFADCILKCKSVFKCRLCPRIVCLSEDTVKAHLTSKKHARSKKLLGEGRLKSMLCSDGEIEEDLETHAERHMRTVALAQEPVALAKKDSGRQRQSRRRKKKQLRNSLHKGKNKKQRKNEV